jgi:hypothetical protein
MYSGPSPIPIVLIYRKKGLVYEHFNRREGFMFGSFLGPVLKIDIPSLGQRNYKICFFGFFKSLVAAAFLLFVDSKVLNLLLLSTSYLFPALKHGSLSPVCIILFCIILELSTKLLVLDPPYIKKRGFCFINVAIFFLEITYFTLYYYYYYYYFCLKVSFHKIAKILHQKKKETFHVLQK